MTKTDQLFWSTRRMLPIAAMIAMLLPGLLPEVGASLSFFMITTAGWRIWSLPRNHKRLPQWLLNTLGLVGVVTWWFLFPSKLALESAVALLFLGTTLKMAEAQHRRDAYVLVYSGFILAAGVLLFNQSLWTTGIVSLSVVLGLLALVEATVDDRAPRTPVGKFYLSISVVTLAIPVTVAWFLIFPRVAPLWAIPVLGDTSKMGMSDTLRPGDISRLGRDASVAFRVSFEGESPSVERLYWRGITLGKFENGTWRQHNYLRDITSSRLARASTTPKKIGTYKIFQKASHRTWLYYLTPSISQSPEAIPLLDSTYRTRWPITADVAHTYARLDRDAIPNATAIPPNLALETVFPSTLNPRALNLVESLVIPGNPLATVARVLDWYKDQPFTYTLEPPILKEANFVDRFLFETQTGFCEHYAYSFVALMRLAGIPARIVGGYLGG